jgi:hypothetical protein
MKEEMDIFHNSYLKFSYFLIHTSYFVKGDR